MEKEARKRTRVPGPEKRPREAVAKDILQGKKEHRVRFYLKGSKK